MFLISRMCSTYLKDYLNLWVAALIESHHLAMFGGHWSNVPMEM